MERRGPPVVPAVRLPPAPLRQRRGAGGPRVEVPRLRGARGAGDRLGSESALLARGVEGSGGDAVAPAPGGLREPEGPGSRLPGSPPVPAAFRAVDGPRASDAGLGEERPAGGPPERAGCAHGSG